MIRKDRLQPVPSFHSFICGSNIAKLHSLKILLLEPQCVP